MGSGKEKQGCPLQIKRTLFVRGNELGAGNVAAAKTAYLLSGKPSKAGFELKL